MRVALPGRLEAPQTFQIAAVVKFSSERGTGGTDGVPRAPLKQGAGLAHRQRMQGRCDRGVGEWADPVLHIGVRTEPLQQAMPQFPVGVLVYSPRCF